MSQQQKLSGWLKRSLKIGALTIALTAGSYAAYCGIIVYDGNFHAVDPGVIYRSAQLTEAEFENVSQQYGIKSILNLRSVGPADRWYNDEIAAAHRLGIEHFDFPISANRSVPEQQIERILDLARRAPKPLLIHCKSGADRTGLVAALYQFAIRGESPSTADKQLSLYYGHFPYLTSRTGAMDESFWAYVHARSRSASQ